MRVLAVASECYPLAKTGGLADVVGALPPALEALGHEVLTCVPGYPSVFAALGPADEIDAYGELYGGPARVLRGRAAGLDVAVVDAPHLFDRPGQPYTGADGHEWDDNGFRFAALAVVARELALGRVPAVTVDVVHAHDWQAGLVPAYLALDPRARPASVMTIHNLSFQGQMPAAWLGRLGLPAHAFSPAGVEYYGSVGFLKAGLYYADQLTTVSPTYAREIQGTLWGMGMEGLLAARAGDLTGIVNGIDTAIWDPATDALVDPRYDADTLERRAEHKAALQARFGLEETAERPLFAIVNRLSWQKGTDLLLEALDGLVGAGGQLVILGSGDPGMEGRCAAAASLYPGRVATWFGYDEALAHRLQAGADAIVVPSRFEPCGLTQLYALRYGCVPVVAATGGLVDTVSDADADEEGGTGFVFDAGDAGALREAFHRVAAAWRNRSWWRTLQRRGMARDLGWERAAGDYVGVYERAMARRRGR
jgi:starch synthase